MNKFKTNKEATALIRRAEALAIKELEGKKATAGALDEFAYLIKRAIMAQVLLGQWAELGVTEVDQLHELKVSVRLGRAFGEKPIVPEYDFSRTLLASLLIDRRRT